MATEVRRGLIRRAGRFAGLDAAALDEGARSQPSAPGARAHGRKPEISGSGITGLAIVTAGFPGGSGRGPARPPKAQNRNNADK
jgi:hypothetical protein